MTSNYPFNDSVSAILQNFKLGCQVVLVFSGLAAGVTGFQMYTIVSRGNEPEFIHYIVLILSILGLWFLYFVMFANMPEQKLKEAVMKKAMYESVLYTTLIAICKLEGGLKTPPLEAYVKHLLNSRGDHGEHLQNLSTDEAKAVFEVCQGLIEKEKAWLANKRPGEISGVTIENCGNYILRLETMADCVRQLPKISAYDMPPLHPEANNPNH